MLRNVEDLKRISRVTYLYTERRNASHVIIEFATPYSLLDTHFIITLLLGDENDLRSREARRAAAEERQRVMAVAREIRRKLDPLEERIGRMEARQTEIDAELCDASVLCDSFRVQALMVERGVIAVDLPAAYEEWGLKQSHIVCLRLLAFFQLQTKER